MAKNNITAAQFGTYLLASVAALAMMNLAPMFCKHFNKESWFFLAVISLSSLLFLLFLALVVKKTEYQEVLWIFKKNLGNSLGIFLFTLLSIYLLILCCFSLRIFTFIVNLYYLPETPLIVISALLMLPTVYTIYGGLRGFGHTTTLLFYFIPAFLFLFLLTKDNYIFANLFPLTEGSIGQMLPSTPLYFVTSFTLVGAFFMLPKICNRHSINRHILLFSLLSFFLMLFVYAIGKSYFGDALNELTLPFHNLSTPYKGKMMERLDVLYILIFIPVLGLYVSSFFVTFYLSQKQLLPQLNKNHHTSLLVFFYILITLIATYTPLPLGIWKLFLIENVANLFVFAVILCLYFVFLLKRSFKHENR